MFGCDVQIVFDARCLTIQMGFIYSPGLRLS
jgi:hypothetical protein